MRVNPSANNASVDPLRTAADTSRPAGKGGAVAGATGDVASFSRSAELTRLLTALQDQPDVRNAVLATVALKVQAGELETRSAALEAAAGFHDAIDER